MKTEKKMDNLKDENKKNKKEDFIPKSEEHPFCDEDKRRKELENLPENKPDYKKEDSDKVYDGKKDFSK